MGTSNIRTASQHNDLPGILFDLSSCKYENIEANGIVYQGRLFYLSVIFKEYWAVATILNKNNREHVLGLYLFKRKTMNLKKIFFLDQQTIINEVITRSNIPANNLKLIQMKFNENDQAEIFGTETQREIDNWKRLLGDLTKSLTDSVYLQPSEKNEDSINTNSEEHRSILYPEFGGRNNQIDHLNSPDSGYSIVADIDQSRANSLLPMRFYWNDVFYLNERNDSDGALAQTRQFGAFLVRPSSTETNHYTLCVYLQQLKIRCFPISQKQNKNKISNFRLPNCQSGREFDSIVELCQYYIRNPLPTSDRIYLKTPYKFLYH